MKKLLLFLISYVNISTNHALHITSKKSRIIKRQRVNGDPYNRKRDELDCCICSENISNAPISQLYFHHGRYIAHRACIKKTAALPWGPGCPLCREKDWSVILPNEVNGLLQKYTLLHWFKHWILGAVYLYLVTEDVIAFLFLQKKPTHGLYNEDSPLFLSVSIFIGSLYACFLAMSCYAIGYVATLDSVWWLVVGFANVIGGAAFFVVFLFSLLHSAILMLSWLISVLDFLVGEPPAQMRYNY